MHAVIRDEKHLDRQHAARAAGLHGARRVAALDFPPAMLRRLRELGFLPGSTVTALHRAPFGGSTAYGVLDTVVALRDGDARRITLQ